MGHSQTMFKRGGRSESVNFSVFFCVVEQKEIYETFMLLKLNQILLCKDFDITALLVVPDLSVHPSER